MLRTLEPGAARPPQGWMPVTIENTIHVNRRTHRPRWRRAGTHNHRQVHTDTYDGLLYSGAEIQQQNTARTGLPRHMYIFSSVPSLHGLSLRLFLRTSLHVCTRNCLNFNTSTIPTRALYREMQHKTDCRGACAGLPDSGH